MSEICTDLVRSFPPLRCPPAHGIARSRGGVVGGLVSGACGQVKDMTFAAVGDRQEDLVCKELLRSGEIKGDGGEEINALYKSAGIAPLPASRAVSGEVPKQHKIDCGPIDAASERDGKLCVAALANRT